MTSRSSSRTERLLGWLADRVIRWRGWLVWPQVVLLLACVAYTATNLKFDTQRASLIRKDSPAHRNYQEYRREFSVQDDIVTLVESNDQEKNRQFVERLGAKMGAETNLFADVFFKGDLAALGSKALLFLPEDQLESLARTLEDYQPLIATFTSVTNLNSLFREINQRFRTSATGRETNASPDSLLKAVPALKRIVDQASDALTRPGLPPSPGINALFDPGAEAERAMYITFGEGRIYVVTTRTHRAEDNKAAITRLRELAEETRAEVPGVNVGITGEPVLEIDEMLQSQKDTLQASVVAVVLVALMFVFGYHETGRPLKATFCLLFGLGYTMAFTTFAIGHLNILTITFAPMLIGLAIDFGVHLISRYEEELRHGHSEEESIRAALVHTGHGISTGCLTTAGAFLAMTLTDFKGIQEMGLICGAGLVISLVPMMTLLPALLLRGRQNRLDHDTPPHRPSRTRIENFWLTRPRMVLLVVVVVSGLSVAALPRVRFDYNLLNMQSHNLPAVHFEKKLLDSSSKSLLFGVVVADNVDEAVAFKTRLEALPTVAEVQSMAGFLAQRPERKLETIRRIKQSLATVEFAPAAEGDADARELNITIEATKGYFALGGELATRAGETNLTEDFRELRGSIAELQAKIESDPPGQAGARLGEYERALLADVRGTFRALKTQDDDGGIREEDLPDSLRGRFVGQNGKHLLQVFPKGDVWERAEQEAFIRDLHSVDESATGTPVQLYEYVSLLKLSFQQAALYSLGAITVLVFIHFRSTGSVLLALMPVGLGSLWTLGVMGWFGLPFNPANIMTLPLVVGIGVTNGIHILNRHAEAGETGVLGNSTGKAVLVSALTTIAGFGSLTLAEHQGIQSLGWLMSVGTGACMVAGLSCLPTWLHWRKGKVAA